MKKILFPLICFAAASGIALPAGAADYDYDFNASVLCDATWYGIRRSEGDHSLHSYYLVLGDRELNEEGMPAAGGTYYALDFFGSGPADERAPQPATGTYNFSNTLGQNVLYNDIKVYILDGNGNYEVDRGFTGGRLEITTDEVDGNTYYNYEAFLTDNTGRSHHLTYRSRFIEYYDASQGSMNLEKDISYTGINAYAKYREVNDGTMQVYLDVTDMTRDDEGSYVFNPLPARQMIMELYMPIGRELANGVYTATNDYGAAFTMQTGEIVNQFGVQYAAGSYLQYIFEGQQVAWGCVNSGTLTVSGEGDHKTIKGDFLTDYGFSVKFTFEGDVPLNKLPATGFTENKELDFDGASAVFECVGDANKLNNCRNWNITINPAPGKDHGFKTWICSRGATFFDGVSSETYTASPSSAPWKGEYLKGRMENDGSLSGTWALTEFDGAGNPQVNAPALRGDMQITRHSDDVTYTIKFCLDDNLGHEFKGEWTGVPEMINACNDEAGLSLTTVEAKTIADIYDLTGRRIDNPVSGLFLIRYSDGTIEKKIF